MTTLERNQQTLTQLYQNTIKELNVKHAQNQEDRVEDKAFFERFVEKVEGKVDKLTEIITSVRIDNARWSLGAGALTAVTIEIVKHVWPNK